MLGATRGHPPWPGFGQAFNGQAVRLRTVRALINHFEPDAFVETGTFLGFTTRFFAGNNVPVYTVEVDRSFYLAARLRLAGAPEVNVIRGNSREAIADLASERPFDRPFAYLDAHWWDDLPLHDETSLLIGTWDEGLIVIDDVHIPGDEGYGFDWHHDRPLSLEMLALPEHVLAAYPGVPSVEETGARRGTLYLGWGESGRRALGDEATHGLLNLVGEPLPSNVG